MKISIGVIVKPHGVKGALKIKSDSDFKHERFAKGAVLDVVGHKTLTTLTVEAFNETTPLDLLTVLEVRDRDTAESLRGCVLEIDASSRQTLEEDAFYYNELEGLKAYHNGVFIGEVITVETFPQGPMLRLKKDDQKTVLIPFLKAFVETVDLKEKTLTLTHWEGLW